MKTLYKERKAAASWAGKEGRRVCGVSRQPCPPIPGAGRIADPDLFLNGREFKAGVNKAAPQPQAGVYNLYLILEASQAQVSLQCLESEGDRDILRK